MAGEEIRQDTRTVEQIVDGMSCLMMVLILCM